MNCKQIKEDIKLRDIDKIENRESDAKFERRIKKKN